MIRKHKRFLVTTHIHPEADAIGSELAFACLLKKMGKAAFVVNESALPDECAFLPGSKSLRTVSEQKQGAPFDCMVFLDCSEASRAGKAARLNPESKPTINIDHHISNTRFAGVNWVEPHYSSTCEMVYLLCQKLNVPLDADMALMLYAGMAVDTGFFHYRNASSRSYAIAASLVDKGVCPAEAYNRLFENNRLSDIKALGRILLSIEQKLRGKIAWAVISGRGLKEARPLADLAELVLGLLRSIKGLELAMIFKEVRDKKNQVRVNFRSQSNFDCNYLASCFGGGGHRNASGATIAGNMAEIKNKVIKRAVELMKAG
ncbi:bifunctional oligoribonuclease/PAP phosphatase NrnA [bacterium]|nr:MAG: bifunctional oligoribonuclease/PAP phosphatase NrnA [bacterium]